MTEVLNSLGVNMQPQFWVSVLQIIWINVLLSGDNAIVIALACRGLPQKQRMAGMVLGTGVALILRLIFAGIISTLMVLPYIKIVGGLALVWIAVKLIVPDEQSDDGSHVSDSLWRAVRLIAVADVVMSLDNVIAVAAAADGHFALLVFGLGISIPLIVAGANIIMALLNRFPIIIWAGAALLGWIAGGVIGTDRIVAEYAATFGPGVPHQVELALSVIGAALTLGIGYLGRMRQARHVKPVGEAAE
jgi:YjbE family integral membrane protein